MIATAGNAVTAHCPECRTPVDLLRSRLGVQLRCPECRTWFYVLRERRRRIHRAPRTNHLLFLPPAVPEVVDRQGSSRVIVLCLLALAALALAIAFAAPASQIADRMMRPG